MKIGCANSDNTKLKGGPKSFMDRLKKRLEEKNMYTNNPGEMHVFIALSFVSIPKEISKNKSIKIITRFDGVRNWSLLPPLKIFKIFDKIQLKFLNKNIIKNLQISERLLFQSYFSEKQNKYLMSRYGLDFSSKKSIIIHNGVDINNTMMMAKSNHANVKNFPKIIILHRFHPMKRAIQIPYILEKLKHDYPNFVAYFIGDGVYNPYSKKKNSLEKIKQLVLRLNLSENVRFLGHLNHSEMEDVLLNGDFMLNLSFSDPCPNAVLEVQSYGLPVIAPKHGGIPEIVPNHDLLVDEDINLDKIWNIYFEKSFPLIPVNEYYNKILFLLKNLDYYQNMAQAYICKNNDINNVVEKYIDFSSSKKRKTRGDNCER
jgi:glycosyltransferase involved in cell wall biosynthesis